MTNLLAAAKLRFDFDSEPEEAERYVERWAWIGQDHVPSRTDGTGAERVEHPALFMTGFRSADMRAGALKKIASPPAVSLIVGQYGLGKTALVRRICHLLWRIENISRPEPLPINLAQCRGYLDRISAQQPTATDFLGLIFGHLAPATWLEEHEAELLAAIRGGEVVLLLDSLDELVFSKPQHLSFFSGLAALLDDGKGESLFQAVVCLRLEYLLNYDRHGQDLVGRLRVGEEHRHGWEINFLLLDFFERSRIESYMVHRLSERVFEEVSRHSDLMGILERPLLLRIFCDYTKTLPEDELIAKFASFHTVSDVMGSYVKACLEDPRLEKAQETLSPQAELDFDALALTALDLYKARRGALTIEDIEKFAKPMGGTAPADGPARQEALLASVHKNPLFRRTEEGTIEFTHRSFDEYLVAYGMRINMNSTEGFTEFDELVLNVDTRKFLRSMFDEDTWYTRTYNSYGFNNPEEWLLGAECRPLDPARLAELDTERSRLLDLMTDPDGDEFPFDQMGRPEGTEPTLSPGDLVCAFLDRVDRERSCLHPRYLLYNYEAVAVFLQYRWWETDVQKIEARFSDLLRRGLPRIFQQLGTLEKETLRSACELVVERVLDIAQRLRFGWVRDYTKGGSNADLSRAVRSDEAVWERIQVILADVEETIFPLDDRT